VRFAEPCFAYDKLSLNIVVEESGCARARGRVRMREVASSLRLVDAAIALLLDAPDVPVLKLPSAPPAGMTTVSLELGSGELSMLVVSDGSNKPMRVRLKPPSLQLVGALPALLVDGHLDDVVPAIHSLGMSGTELDR
jgi:NADH-quinone oxidoreductase subunit D